MSYGEKIVTLRKSRGMTQAAMGAALNVTYQAVSKWERDESDPDFHTMSRIAKLFGVPLSYFEDDDADIVPIAGQPETEPLPVSMADAPDETGAADTPVPDEQAETVPVPAEVVPASSADTPAPVPAAEAEPVPVPVPAATEQEAEVQPPRVLVGMCSLCGVAIYEGEVGTRVPKFLCKKCLKNKQDAEARAKREKAEKIRQKKQYLRGLALTRRNRGLIVAAVLTGIWLVIAIVSTCLADAQDVLYSAIGGVIITVFLYAFVAQMFWHGIVHKVCLTGGKWIGTPGVIFTLDLDGIIFLVVAKIFLAILRFLFYLLSMVFFAVIAFLISPFTFVPQLLKLQRLINLKV